VTQHDVSLGDTLFANTKSETWLTLILFTLGKDDDPNVKLLLQLLGLMGGKK
jgi:hypothetical protein